MAGNDDSRPSFAKLRLGGKARRRVTGWEPQAFLFDTLPPVADDASEHGSALEDGPKVDGGQQDIALKDGALEGSAFDDRSRAADRVAAQGPSPDLQVSTSLPASASLAAPFVDSARPLGLAGQGFPNPLVGAASLLGRGTRGARPPVRPSGLSEPRVWTVRGLVAGIRQQVEASYTDVLVEGEISNFRPAPSGHLYFTLKDGEAQLPVVLFRRQAVLLRFRPKDGDEVRLRGRISVYESRGQLQMIAETVELRGAGAQQLAFERLKARLLAEGLFAASRKRPLPMFPKCIGIVTSASGAVLQDIVNVVRRRHGRLNLLVYPATMQGANCAATVAAGVRWFNAHADRADMILIARGGGSFEDLAGFNDEALARVIAGSALPVVSAVGHETDFTIADFVADLRAPTPSAAAEMMTAAQHRIEERLEELGRRARRAIEYHLLRLGKRFDRLSAGAVLARLRDAVSRRQQRVDDLRFRLEAAMARRGRGRAMRLDGLLARLGRQEPRLRVAASRRRLEAMDGCLKRAVQAQVAQRRTRLMQATARLEAMSPLAVLSRGYALVYSSSGMLLRDAAEAVPGEAIRARLARGSVSATVVERISG